MKKILVSLGILFSVSAMAQSNQQLIIGTYTSGKSEGIYVYDFNMQTGKFSPLSKVFTPEPSYLVVTPDHKFVYSVNELGADKGSGTITGFSYSNGTLTKLNTQPTGGDHPCYTSIDKTGKWLVAGNYSGGNFSVYPLNADGSIGTVLYTIQHKGSSIDKSRQEKPHVHCTVFSPDNKYLLVADLGTDQIVSYKFNEKDGSLGKINYTNITPGAGPRHIAFSPNGKYAYLVEEMFGNVDVFKYKKGKFTHQQKISMVPTTDIGKIGAADIHISADGRFLYTSNRGESDKITIFSIESNGKLKVAGYQSVMGIGPRNFVIDPSGNFLLVANQKTDEVVIFKRDKYTGLLTDTNERIKIPSPVCLKWIN